MSVVVALLAVMSGCAVSSRTGPSSAGPATTVYQTTTVASPAGDVGRTAPSQLSIAAPAGQSGGSAATPSPALTGQPSWPAFSESSSPSGTAAVDTAAEGQNAAAASAQVPTDAVTAPSATAEPGGTFTLALAGDVNFAERTAHLLAAGPSTALHEAAQQLSAADVTMVNLETAITTGGAPAPKQFHFRAPATALTALADGGVDVATMANNHAVDYGPGGLQDTLAAIATSPIPVIGIGKDAAQAYAPYTTTVNGVRLAILAASQVHDWTLGAYTATDSHPGIASAVSDRLVAAVKAAEQQADVVVVYLHWGIEYTDCPSAEQRGLADRLAAAGATAVVGTHAHVLQGAGWRPDGTYVAYGLGNYFWWRSFGNAQDDNGVLTLTFSQARVTGATFLPTHLDERGVPMPATGSTLSRIQAEWAAARQCADLLAAPPAG